MYKLQPFKAHINGLEVIVDRENKVGYVNGKDVVKGTTIEDTFIQLGDTLVRNFQVSTNALNNYYSMMDGEY